MSLFKFNFLSEGQAVRTPEATWVAMEVLEDEGVLWLRVDARDGSTTLLTDDGWALRRVAGL